MNDQAFPLAHRYTLREMSEKEFFPLFGQDHTFSPGDFYSAEEKAKLKALGARFGSAYRLHVGVFSPEGEFVGFSFGYQETAETFYMVFAPR